MTPVLVDPPSTLPVDLDALKLHCRVDGTDEDTLLEALRAAAVGWLDGWSGILGRAIMPQTWAIDVRCSGAVLLPLPDVTTATVDYGAGPVDLDITPSAAGPVVVLDAGGIVRFDCAMPAPKLAVAGLIIKMLVQHWYSHRGAVVAGALPGEVPMAANALIETLRWRRV